MKYFKNELGLAGCQDCPRRNPDSENESCCASIPGVFENSYFKEEEFNCHTYDKSSIGDLGVGCGHLLEHFLGFFYVVSVAIWVPL